MCVCARWHLIIDTCKPGSFWSPSAWNPVANWCFCWLFCIVRFFVWSPEVCTVSQFFGGNFRKKEHNFTFTWQKHCAIYTTDLSSVRTRCPPELVALFFCVFFFVLFCFSPFFVIVADRSKRLWNFKDPHPPFFETWIPSRPPVPPPPPSLLKPPLLSCWEKNFAKRKKQLPNCACSEKVLKEGRRGYTAVRTSSLRATATPNTDWIHGGIGRLWVSGTKPNKRGGCVFFWLLFCFFKLYSFVLFS